MTNGRINCESKVYNDARITHQSPDAVRTAYKNGDFSKDPQIGNLLSGRGRGYGQGSDFGNDINSSLGCSFNTNDASSTNFPEITKTGNAQADLMKYAHDNKITLEKAHDILVEKYGEAGSNSTSSSGSFDITGPQNIGDWNPTGESPSNNSTCSSGSNEQKTVSIDGHKITLTGNPNKDLATAASILGCNETEAKQKLQTYVVDQPS